MGPQTKSFAGQALEGATLNADLMPTGLGVSAITADKKLREQLVPLFERLPDSGT